jgi:hypothetical protein
LIKRRLGDISGYEALSYTWAFYDALDPQDHGDENALRRLRYSDQSRGIWVDSICINQWNMKERGHQVRLTGDIFQNALSVINYLGVESSDSDLALQLLHRARGVELKVFIWETLLLSNLGRPRGRDDEVSARLRRFLRGLLFSF